MSRHLLIAGTGRAGTSFLVRYLTRLGLETHLSRAGAAAIWNEEANAGLEDLPLPDARDLPYVIKSPWTYQFIHDLVAHPMLDFDAVVVPMRDLTEAAASRCIVELQAMHNSLPWMRELSQTWEHFAHTPGGVIFSVNPVDQARLLAVGFHHLLDQVVKADIPVVLLSFPRLIEDADYLHRKLADVLPQRIPVDLSRVAHAETADRCKVRVGIEIGAALPADRQGLRLHGPVHDQLDRAALQRSLARVSHEFEVARAQAAEVELAARNERNRDLQALQTAQQQLVSLIEEKAVALSVSVEDMASANTAVQALCQKRDRLAADAQAAGEALIRVTEERNEIRQALERAQRELDGIRRTTTWHAALKLQTLAAHLGWAAPVLRWLFRPRVRRGLSAADRA